MPSRALRLSILCVPLLALSCTPYRGPSSNQKLLVDKKGPRYGEVIRHGDQLSIPIKRGGGIGELFVPVTIGSSRGWWQIDTGAPFCVVNTKIAGHEGFAPITEGQIVTPAGRVSSQYGKLPSVRLGGLEIRNVAALSLNDTYVNEFRIDGRRGGVIGILGADLLDHLDATIDFRANLLRLRAP